MGRLKKATEPAPSTTEPAPSTGAAARTMGGRRPRGPGRAPGRDAAPPTRGRSGILTSHPHGRLQPRHSTAGWSSFPPPRWSNFAPPLTARAGGQRQPYGLSEPQRAGSVTRRAGAQRRTAELWTRPAREGSPGGFWGGCSEREQSCGRFTEVTSLGWCPSPYLFPHFQVESTGF